MQRDINFFAVYHSPLDNNSNGKDPITIIGIIAVSACIVVVLGLFGVLKLFDTGLSLEISNINQFLSSTSVATAQKSVAGTQNKINAINNYKNAVSGAYKQYQTLPIPDSILISAISKVIPDDVKISNMTYASSVITLQCTCTNQQSPVVFVNALKTSGNFDNIVYNGYAINDKNEYAFNLTFSSKGATSK
jgi:hypothetical protein